MRLGDSQWARGHGHKGEVECGRRHRLNGSDERTVRDRSRHDTEL
jgi:hypothetical protein